MPQSPIKTNPTQRSQTGIGIDDHGLGDSVLDHSEGLHGPGGNGLSRYWSRHPGGAHFTMCDGSVRFVSFSINRQVFRTLGSRNGNEVVSDF